MKEDASQKDVIRKKEGKEAEKLNKKIVLTVLVCLSVMMLVAQLISGQNIAQSEDGFYDRHDPWSISGTLVLDWDLYSWHTVRFVDCLVGFNITADDAVLDLNGHKAMFVRESELGQGRAGIEVKGKNGVTIKNGTIINFQYGIEVSENSTDVNILFNDVSASTRQGITVRNSNNVKLAFNTVSEVAIIGVRIEENCFDVSIINNTVSRPGDVGIGVYDDCFDISVLNNTITVSGDEGIHLTDSDNIIVRGNKISDCAHGIYLYNSNNNTIDNNTLLSNMVGIHVENTNQNTFYHNNFIANEDHVTNVGSTNSWDVGYGTAEDIGHGGNYWENYDGADDYSGTNQDVQGSDGIGDTLYTIDANNQDNYPLMEPWGLMLRAFDITWKMYVSKIGNISVTCSIGAFSNSSVIFFNFDKTLKQISFNVTKGTFCNLIIPREILDGAFIVLIDDIPTASVLKWDENHHFLYFIFSNDNHNVKITGEMIPKIVGDLDGDGEVTIIDMALAAKNWGKKLWEED